MINRIFAASLNLNPKHFNCMKFKSLLFAGALLLAAHGMAQTPSNTNGEKPMVPMIYSPKQASVPLWLDLAVGTNYADCYDVSTIPFKYLGAGRNYDLGLNIEWGRCHLRPAFRMINNTFTNPSGTARDFDFSTEFLYRVYDNNSNRLHLWAGATLGGFVDIKNIPSLQNASTTISIFGDLGATGLLQYDFAISKSKNHPWLTTYFKLNMPLCGVANRPGFAYLGDPAINQELMETLFSCKETFGKFFPGVNTDLGLYLNLLNGNRIGLTYRWDYLTTGKKGVYRYDNAIHSFNLSFMFRLN